MDYPKELLTDVSWSFGLGKIEDREEFYNELLDFNGETGGSPNLNENILEVSKIVLAYEAIDEDDDYEEREKIIESANDQNFTLKELMYQINLAIADEVEDQDHCFFEGLTFLSVENGVPVYELFLGS